MRFALIIGMAVLNFIAAPDAAAEVQTTIAYEYYPVTPTPGRALYNQMFKDSTIVHNNRKVVAETHWDIRPEVSYRSLDDGCCEIERYIITMPCKIILPRLASDEKRLNDAFAAYIPFLKEHELQHCLIAADHANKLDGALKVMEKMKCSDLKTAVKAARNKAIVEAKKAHRLFDKQTLENRKMFSPGKHFLGDLFPASE